MLYIKDKEIQFNLPNYEIVKSANVNYGQIASDNLVLKFDPAERFEFLTPSSSQQTIKQVVCYFASYQYQSTAVNDDS